MRGEGYVIIIMQGGAGTVRFNCLLLLIAFASIFSYPVLFNADPHHRDLKRDNTNRIPDMAYCIVFVYSSTESMVGIIIN